MCVLSACLALSLSQSATAVVGTHHTHTHTHSDTVLLTGTRDVIIALVYEALIYTSV
jgi:calcineurin-like phosphoesterase